MAFGDLGQREMYTAVSGSGDFETGDFNRPPSQMYLQQLKDEAKSLESIRPTDTLPTVTHLLNQEINTISQALGQDKSLDTKVTANMTGSWQKPFPPTSIKLERKLHVPIDEHPNYNFIGRILGPRGMTVKQMELETGCDIVVRGRGSVRDEKKEKTLKGKDLIKNYLIFQKLI